MHHVIEEKYDGRFWRPVSSVIRDDAEKDRQLACWQAAYPDTEFKVTSWRGDALLAR